MSTFKELGLSEEILHGIEDLGFVEPMPIQEKVTPFLLGDSTEDLVALAQTGTGKTAGFGLPLLQLTDSSVQKIQALVLSPTRELCIQISNDLKNFSKYIKGMKIVPVYGGENIVTQFKQLDVPPQILVATPGRLIDLIERGKVKLSSIRYLVLDEADEMLNMGFQEDIERILQEIPEERRTLLFSATMPKEIANIAKKYMRNSVEIAIGRKNSGTENVEHIYYMVQAKDRYNCLKRVVDINPDIYAIIFCRTRQETKDVAEKLMQDGYNADALHGDLSQAQRDTVMQRFRNKTLQILVATDVAARGLDVNNLTHVINYNLPDDVENYTHRSGRTGRAGKKGISISIIHSKEKGKIKTIERTINRTFVQQTVPSGLEVCKSQLFSLINRIQNAGENIDKEQIQPYLPMIMEQLKDLSREDLIVNFVSQEFNRFLEYYKNAPDLNIPEKDKKSRGDRDRSGRGGRRSSGDLMRLKINMGSRDGFTPKRVLGLINDTTDSHDIDVHDIEITSRYSFFDVDKSVVPSMMNAFARQKDGIQLMEVFKDRRSRREGLDDGEGRERRNRDRDRKRSRDDRDWKKGKGSDAKNERPKREFRRNKDSFRRNR
ncbi:MAG: DEAD/DEAH box helicase [Paludibacteraceae bacterium]|nr:DEAD/DEAH box helicase [Paludibacteraceae bacterium]MEE3482749.1 DEAD/DEAH box helicase [Bacteroidales bacterium]